MTDFIGVPEYQSWEQLCKDEAFLEIYEMFNDEHLEGGNLHTVLSDGNNSDDDIIFCYNCAKENGDVAGMFIASKLISVYYEDREKYNWNVIKEK